MKYTNNDLILNLQDGTEYSLERLYSTNCKNVYYCAFKILKNHQDAQDIVQEIFLIVINSFNHLEKIECFSKWLNTITVRESIKLIKKRRKLVCYENICDVIDNKHNNNSIYNINYNIINRERNNILYESIKRLDSKKYNVIVLYFFQELSLTDISIKLNCPVGTIKSRLHMAKKELYRLNNFYIQDKKLFNK